MVISLPINIEILMQTLSKIPAEGFIQYFIFICVNMMIDS